MCAASMPSSQQVSQRCNRKTKENEMGNWAHTVKLVHWNVNYIAWRGSSNCRRHAYFHCLEERHISNSKLSFQLHMTARIKDNSFCVYFVARFPVCGRCVETWKRHSSNKKLVTSRFKAEIYIGWCYLLDVEILSGFLLHVLFLELIVQNTVASLDGFCSKWQNE